VTDLSEQEQLKEATRWDSSEQEQLEEAALSELSEQEQLSEASGTGTARGQGQPISSVEVRTRETNDTIGPENVAEMDEIDS